MKDGREWRLPGLLYVDDSVLCDEPEEDLRAMMGRFLSVQENMSESKCREEQGDGTKWKGGIGE